jgi:hypothetical protein
MKKRIFTGILLIIGFILMSTVATVSADGGLFIPFRYFLTKMRRNFSQEEMDNDLVVSKPFLRKKSFTKRNN